MALQDNTNIVDNIVSTQKQVLDTIVENTKKLTSANPVVSETIEKGSEWYKNWLEGQKNMFTKTTEQAASATEHVKESAKETSNKANEFFETFMKTQMENAKKIWDMAAQGNTNHSTSSNPFAAFTSFNNTNHTANPFMNNNPFTQWQNNMNNMNNMNQWTNWMNGFQNNNWMNNMQNMNPFSADSYKKATEPVGEAFTKFYEMMNNGFADWQKNFQGGTIQDAYKNMINTGMGFSKFTEIWEPMFKSIQDKSFNMDVYKQMMNPELYKDMMDKYLGFLPENSRKQMQDLGNMFTDGMKQMSEAGMNGYNQMRGMTNNPAMNHSQIFGDMLNGYNTWHSKMAEAAAPFNKMVTPNQYTKAISTWNDLSNRITVYNIKNAELQYMIYNQGQKVMDALAENTAKKVKEGKEVTSMLGLYQEWLNISDKVFVSLFESDDYSKLMAEVGSLQTKLRRDIDLQLEKSMESLPVAKRSEMDDLYKTIHDLKKQVKNLEKLVAQHTEAAGTEEKPAKASKKA